MMPTQQFNNYANLITFTRASSGTALRPISYGAEILPNGDFSQGSTGWFVGVGWSISGGVATHTGAGGNLTSTPASAFTTGLSYVVEFDYSGNTGVVGVYVKGAFHSPVISAASGRFEAVIVAGSAPEGVSLYATAGLVVDNFSVKQVIFDQAGDPLTLFNHPNNVPRIEYDANRNRLGLLIEEARTNDRVPSEDLSLSGSTSNPGGGVTFTGSQPDPNGGTTGFVLSGFTTTNEYRSLFNSSAVTAGQTWTASIWLKGIAGQTVEIRATRQGAGVFEGTTRVVTLNGQWQRESVSHTFANNQTSMRLDVGRLTVASTTTSVGLSWCQIELGAFPTSYIPTTGAAATRAADIASIPTSAFGYNTTAGTVVCEFDTQYAPSTFRRIWELGSTASGANRIVAFVNAAASTVNAEVVSNSVTQAGFTLYTDPTPAVGKVALAFTENSFFATSNGSAAQIDSAGTMTPSVPRTLIKLGGATTNSADNMSGHLKSLQYYPRPLSPAQIQELTR